MDKLNTAIRNTIGDLVVQTIMLSTQVEELKAQIAEMQAGANGPSPNNKGLNSHQRAEIN